MYDYEVLVDMMELDAKYLVSAINVKLQEPADGDTAKT